MNKLSLLFLFGMSLFLSCPSAVAGNVSVGPSKSKLYKNFNDEIIKNYNILLTSYEGGISTYAGVKAGLRLNFTAQNEEVSKVVFMFDNDISSAVRQATIAEIIAISAELLPKKIKSDSRAASRLEDKIKALKRNQDGDVFMLDHLRVELNLRNDILNIRVTP